MKPPVAVRRVIGPLLGAALVLTLSAQKSLPFPEPTIITSQDGLSQNEITDIIKDRRGYLWVGTRSGLNQYDGFQFRIFQNEIGNPNSLSNGSVETLLEDRQGRIWVGTKSGGISIYDPVHATFEHLRSETNQENGLSGNRIISMLEDRQGRIWIGTWQNGLTIYDPSNGSFRHELDGRQVNTIVQTTNGTIWVAANNGLHEFSETGKWKQILNTPDRREHSIISLTATADGQRLLLGTWSDGMYLYDPQANHWQHFDPRLGNTGPVSSRNFYWLINATAGQYWIGSWGGGLNRYDENTDQFEHFEIARMSEQKLVDELYRDILCVFQDTTGFVWVGTNGGGLVKLDLRGDRFNIDRESGAQFPREPIWSVMETTQGHLWVGTKGSPYAYQRSAESGALVRVALPKTYSRYAADGKSDNQSVYMVNPSTKNGIRTFYESNSGRLYASSNYSLLEIISTTDGYRMESRYVEQKRTGRRIFLPQVSRMLEDQAGYFWIGTQQQGLWRSVRPGMPDETTFQQYLPGATSESLRSTRITDLLEDVNGYLWVGTYGGLHRYRPDTDDFQVFTKELGNLDALSSDIILCLHQDRRGTIWIGTPNGLNRLQRTAAGAWQFKCLQTKDGLPNNYIHGIEEDEDGYLWVSTNRGLARYCSEDQVFINYDVNDGLSTNSFMENASFRGANGRIYFGGTNGLTSFHPKSVRTTSEPPIVALRGLKIFNETVQPGQRVGSRLILEQSIDQTDGIKLAHHQDVFSIDYTAIAFRAPDKIHFAYRLVGLEEAWHEVGGQRSVTYANLAPGNYIFEVQAASDGANWSPEAARLHIQVLPPFWASWPAYILYGFVIAGLLMLYRAIIQRQNNLKSRLSLARLAREKEMEVAETKARFFTNITHELRTPLTLIAGPVAELLASEKQMGRHKEFLIGIHQNTQRLLKLVSQLLDFRKAENGQLQLQVAPGNFVRFAREIVLSFNGLAQQNNIQLRFEPAAEELLLCYDRNQLEIVLCNLLSNALKYSQAETEVEVRLQTHEATHLYPEGFCRIEVRDQGPGMPAELTERIFDRFYQIANSESVSVVGTGIGLSLAKSIVELHGGTIHVESKVGVGSTFIVEIPRGQSHFTESQLLKTFRDSEFDGHYQLQESKPELVVAKAEVEPDPADDQPIHILIVEDNTEIRKFLRALLSPNYQLSEAENGTEGLQLARALSPDLILSDVMMPQMDGLTLCKELKQDVRTTHIPLILLTARTATVYQVDGYHSGADAYVTKPFEPSILRAQIESLLSGREQLRKYYSQKVTLEPTDAEITDLDKSFLETTMQFIEQHLDNGDFSRDDLAAALSMSPSTFYRKLKALTGQTTSAFVRSVRLKRAADLLQNSHYTISEIAYQVGFSDPKYFRQCFRKQFGQSPSVFRNERTPV